MQLLYPLEVHQCYDAIDNDASVPALNDCDLLDREQSQTKIADTNGDSANNGEPELTQGKPRRQYKRTAAKNTRQMIRTQAENS